MYKESVCFQLNQERKKQIQMKAQMQEQRAYKGRGKGQTRYVRQNPRPISLTHTRTHTHTLKHSLSHSNTHTHTVFADISVYRFCFSFKNVSFRMYCKIAKRSRIWRRTQVRCIFCKLKTSLVKTHSRLLYAVFLVLRCLND